eukprot:871457-Rhodomonas_salina.1
MRLLSPWQTLRPGPVLTVCILHLMSSTGVRTVATHSPENDPHNSFWQRHTRCEPPEFHSTLAQRRGDLSEGQLLGVVVEEAPGAGSCLSEPDIAESKCVRR